VDERVNQCSKCDEILPSRNKLFKHIKNCKKEVSTNSSLIQKGKSDSDCEGEYFYVTGGRHRGKTLGSCERYSIKNGIWQPVGSLIDNRGSHGSEFANGKLYVMSGGGFKSNLATCEVYDFKIDSWKNIAPMPSDTLRHALSVVKLSNYIYSIGGWQNGSVSSSVVERYDT